MSSSEREGLKKIAEDRLREWRVQDSDYLTCHNLLGPGGVQKILQEASVPLEQAAVTNPNGLRSWTLDTILGDALNRTDLGQLVLTPNGPTFKPSKAKVEVE